MPSPDRGDVWLADLSYAAKTRPCLVMSVPFDPQGTVCNRRTGTQIVSGNHLRLHFLP